MLIFLLTYFFVLKRMHKKAKLIQSLNVCIMVSQILMTVIPAHVRTMEHVLTVCATTLAPAYLDLKERTAPLVSINEQP